MSAARLMFEMVVDLTLINGLPTKYYPLMLSAWEQSAC